MQSGNSVASISTKRIAENSPPTPEKQSQPSSETEVRRRKRKKAKKRLELTSASGHTEGEDISNQPNSQPTDQPTQPNSQSTGQPNKQNSQATAQPEQPPNQPTSQPTNQLSGIGTHNNAEELGRNTQDKSSNMNDSIMEVVDVVDILVKEGTSVGDIRKKMVEMQETVNNLLADKSASNISGKIKHATKTMMVNMSSFIDKLIEENSRLEILVHSNENEYLKEKNTWLKEQLESEKRHSEQLASKDIEMQNVPTYADMVRHEPTELELVKKSKPEHAIIIEQVNPKSYEKTDALIKKNVNPTIDQVHPDQMKPISKNRVIMRFKTKAEAEHTMQVITNKVPDVKVEHARKRMPCFIIKGILKNATDDEILQAIVANHQRLTNSTTPINPNNDLRIRVRLKNRKSEDRQNVIIECIPSIYKSIVSNAKLAISWEIYHVEHYDNIVQCLRCCGYGHTTKWCPPQTPVICYKCGSIQHEGKTCKVESHKCTNCIGKNATYKSNYDTNHSALHKDCSSRKEVITIIRNRTDYGY